MKGIPFCTFEKNHKFQEINSKNAPCSGSKSMATLTLVIKFSIKIYLIVFTPIIKQNQNLIANIL
jgi:hypothetical protein